MVNNCYQQTDNVDLNLLHKYICLNKDNKLALNDPNFLLLPKILFKKQ